MNIFVQPVGSTAGAGAHHRGEGPRHSRLFLEGRGPRRLSEGRRRRRERPHRRRRPARRRAEGRDAVPRREGAGRRSRWSNFRTGC